MSIPPGEPKCFVLDTNVLLHSANALTSFEDNNIVLPMKVLEEVDTFKTHNDERGRNARMAIRAIDAARGGGSLREGVPIGNGGSLRVMTATLNETFGLDQHHPDNKILAVAEKLKSEGENVIFVSKDINARVKADAIGICAEDFEKQKIRFDELYAGWRKVTCSKETVDTFYEQNFLEPDEEYQQNEFVMLEDEGNPKHTAIGRFDAGQNRIIQLMSDRGMAWNVKPRSFEQRMALEVLLDPDVHIVTLIGQAGTGKTLLALAAALQDTIRANRYEKILVTRPIMPLGRDIGYLPGSMENKLSHWMHPIFDNLKYLLSGKMRLDERSADDLIESGIVELEALTYIRGRSIASQVIIVDEAQNLTPHEIKTIVSRAGEDTKMVLTGDPYQIDNPYLDASSNGLTYAADRLKGSPLAAHMTLTRSERSPLASLAADRL